MDDKDFQILVEFPDKEEKPEKSAKIVKSFTLDQGDIALIEAAAKMYDGNNSAALAQIVRRNGRVRDLARAYWDDKITATELAGSIGILFFGLGLDTLEPEPQREEIEK